MDRCLGPKWEHDHESHIEKSDGVTTITINRPKVRNAIDRDTATQLADAFRAFESDSDAKVAVLTGAAGHFSAGLDLKALARGETPNISEEGDSVMGPLRLRMRKRTIAAVEGFAVAGGMALAVWCDLRVAAKSAVFGMLDRKVGVPILGAVTVSLPRQIGLSHSMDIILTGRRVPAEEAHRMGLVNRLVEDGTALRDAQALAGELAALPWAALVTDRLSLIEGLDLPRDIAERNEFRRGLAAFGTPEMHAGATAVAAKTSD